MNDNFNNMSLNSIIPNWTIYSGDWAPVNVKDFHQVVISLELRDKDRYEYAKAIRVFPQSAQTTIKARIYPNQTSGGGLEFDFENELVPDQFVFNLMAVVRSAQQGGSTKDVQGYSAKQWYDVEIAVDATTQKYSLKINGIPN